jgi:peptidylprolyl isomerase
MQKAQIGHRARIHYTAKLQNGKAVGSSKGGQPLSFTIGRGKLLRGLEEEIIGMEVGQVKEIELPPEKGYGTRNESLVMKLDRSKLPKNSMLEKGRVVQYRSETQEIVNLLVLDLDEKTVTVDGNHPFAGETLFYTVHLVGLE